MIKSRRIACWIADHRIADTDSPFTAMVLVVGSQAGASMDRVVCADHARPDRTWQRSSPAAFLACWKHSVKCL